jgi:hypothetical protein
MIGGSVGLAVCAAVAATSLCLAGIGAARAGDLGGTCCMDLEERVAELESSTARKGNRKVSLLLTGQLNRTILYWNDGGKSDAFWGLDNTNSSSRFSIIGEAKVSPSFKVGFEIMLEMEAGGTTAKASQLDEDGRFSSTQPYSNFTSFNASNTDSFFGDARRAAVWFEHSTIGRFTLGRYESAGVVNTIDLGGIGVIAGPTFTFFNGGFYLRSSNNGQLTSAQLGNLVDAGAYQGRTELLRYDSPAMHGFIASASIAEAGDYWGTMLRYANDFAGFRVAAGIGFEKVSDVNTPAVLDPTVTAFTGPKPDTSAWGGALSVMHVPTGFFMQGHYQSVRYDGPLNDNYWGNGGICTAASNPDCNPTGKKADANQWLLQAGVSKNWFGIGATAVYGEYGQANDWGALTANGRDFPVGAYFGNPFNTGAPSSNNFTGILGVTDTQVNMWGLGLVQNIDAAATELYLGYRHFSPKMNGTEVTGSCDAPPLPPACTQTPTGAPKLDDLHIVGTGARIRF